MHALCVKEPPIQNMTTWLVQLWCLRRDYHCLDHQLYKVPPTNSGGHSGSCDLRGVKFRRHSNMTLLNTDLV